MCQSALVYFYYNLVGRGCAWALAHQLGENEKFTSTCHKQEEGSFSSPVNVPCFILSSDQVDHAI